MPTHLDLSLSSVRAFLAVVDFGKEAAAGKYLGIAQPTVNKQRKQLEEWLGGLPLLDGKPLRLTPLGEAFLPVARSIVEQLDAARPNAKSPIQKFLRRSNTLQFCG